MKKTLIGVLCIFAVFAAKAQHFPLFSQYMFNGLVINPAYATGQDGLNAIMYYKKQWVGFEGTPSTLSGTLQSTLKKEKISIGLIFLNDTYGLKTQNDLSGSFAYRINTGKGKLGLGISGGMSAIYNDQNKINTTDNGDPAFSGTNNYKVLPKIGMGLYYNTPNFFSGISIPQWLIYDKETHTTGILARSLVGYSGYSLKINPQITITPSLLIKFLSATPAQVDYNLTATWKKIITAGVSYRMYNAVVFLFQYHWENFALGYAYDYTIGPISKYTAGSHEFMISYAIKYEVSVPDPKKF